MALINCKDCGKQISTSAKNCLGCGAKNPSYIDWEKATPGLIFILLTIIAIIWVNWPESVPVAKKTEVEPQKMAITIPLKDIDFEKFKKEITTYFTSKNEPSVKDATWTQNNIFKLGRFYEGKSQDGFAEYACLIMKEKGLKREVLIQIVDMEKIITEKRFNKIGETYCKP